MAFEFSAGGHPTSKPYFQSSFARSLSFNTNQSQSLDFELSFRIAGKPADDDLIPILPPPTATDTPSPPASPTSATPPPLPTSPPPSVSDTYDEQPDTARGADSRGGDSAPTSPPPSPQPSSSSAHHHATGVLDAAGTLIHPVLMQTPKPKNGRMYLPSTTPKRRYATLRSQEMPQSKSSVSAEIEVLRLRKECQSLIEDNRRLISAADRQARSDQTAIDHHHHHLNRQLHQHHNHHHNHHQHRHQTSQTVAASARGGGGGGCNTPKSNVETVVLQTQVDTLQWQLKQVESSRQMYHAVMEEVVRFLERCHQTLNAATDANRAPMSRSKSVNHVFVPNDTSSLLNEPIRARQRTSTHTADLRKYSQPSMMMMSSLDENLDMSVTGRASDPFANMKDLTWRRSPKHSAAASNTSPHADPSKLSQEAFRLLRTAQNLLNLKEPILAETKKSLAISDDLDKTVRCATPLMPPSVATMQRKTNCRESRLSMQSSTDDSVHSSSSSRHETDEELLLGYVGVPCIGPSTPFHLQSSASTASSSSSSSSGMSHGQQQQQQLLHHHPHHHQPRVKSVASSADDESGFSSMSSFQDVGLPLHAAVMVSASQPPELPPRSRLSTASVISASNDNAAKSDTDLAGGRRNAVSSAVRMRPAPARPLSICHRRWSSTPAPPVPPKRSLSTFEGDGEPLKVLWV